MGVYRPKRKRKDGREVEAPFWHFDFVIAGERFHGSTGQKSKRAAEAFEERKRQEVARGEHKRPAVVAADITIDAAANLYWEAIGSRRPSRKEIERMLEVMITLIGAHTRIGDINTGVVQKMIARRRKGEGGRTRGTPSVATINRLIEQTRAVLRHVENTFEDAALPRINWRSLHERERALPDRQFSLDELEAWGSQLEPLERAFLLIASTYAPRFGELFVPPEAVDARRGILRLGRYLGRDGWRNVRKDGTVIDIPLAPGDAALLGALADRAAAAGLPTIWAEYRGKRLCPVPYGTMAKRLRRGAERAGVRAERLLHALRHHGASTIVAHTGDITLAKRLLGHADIATTQRYTHARESLLADALAAISRNSPERPAIGDLSAHGAQAFEVVPPPGFEPGATAPEPSAQPLAAHESQHNSPKAEGDNDA